MHVVVWSDVFRRCIPAQGGNRRRAVGEFRLLRFFMVLHGVRLLIVYHTWSHMAQREMSFSDGFIGQNSSEVRIGG